MASLLKLQLQGIRAFDSHEPETLQFSTPLTLICGQNGVGKTTIIEALRYATTGDLPPNAKGGAFVHDPRMAAEADVHAQVKLLYIDSQRHRMVVTRSMRLSISAKGTATFKTLEGQLKAFGAEGAAGSVSSRCADLNTQIPLSLGVPAPILNFVVFCHQEDSLWPLAEPSIVKRRFDEIFEATKYSKALESLKVIHKNYKHVIPVNKVNVEHLKSDSERSREKKQQLVDLESRVQALNEECSTIKEYSRTKTAELNDAVALSQQFQQLEYALKDAKRVARALTQDAELLRSDTELLNDPTPTLEQQLADWDSRASELNITAERLQRRRRELEADADSVRQTLAGLSNQQGRIEQALDAHKVMLSRRTELSSHRQPAEYRRELDEQRASLDENLNEVEVSHRQQEAELSNTISAQEAQVLTLKQTAVDRRTTVRDAEARVAALQEQIDGHDREHTQTDANYMDTALAGLKKQASEAAGALAELAESGHIEKAQARIAEHEVAAKSARSHLQEAIEANSAQSRLKFLRDSLQEAEMRRTEALRLIRTALEAPEAGREAAETALVRSKALETDRVKHASQLKDELSSSRQTVAMTDERVGSLEREMHEIEQALTVSPKEFQTALNDAEEDVVVTTENREQAAFAHRFFAEALAKAKSKTPVCLLCEHHHTETEATSFIERLVVRLEALPMSPEAAAKEAESAREHLEGLRQQAQPAQRWHQIMTELTETKNAVAQEQANARSLEARLDGAQTEAQEAAEKHEHLHQALSRPLSILSHVQNDARDLQIKIDTEVAILSGAETQTPQQAQKVLEEAEADLRTSQSQLEALREEEMRRGQRLQSLEQRVASLKLRISEYDLANTKRQQAEQAQLEARDTAKRAQLQFDEVQLAIPSAEAAVQEAQASLRRTKHSFATVERELVERRSTIIDSMRQFDALDTDIRAFEAQYGVDPLSNIMSERKKSECSLSSLERELIQTGEEISQQERSQSDLGSHQRRLRDNLRLRELEHKLATALEKEGKVVAKYRTSRDRLGNYEQHIQELQDVVGSANAEVAMKTGEVKEMSNQIRAVQHELATTYKNTVEDYRMAVAQLETSEGAVRDLAKYVHALDAAIMQYHSVKMAEINELLDELWRKTYTGTDIDTILIRSESDAASASTRALYNYRVCMVKQDTELDMRGRCSAGQKVLASILIRMALAECFGSKLGLIVLDEPTTNLDHENIGTLAQSLSGVIAERQGQRNFQLIVITHDEHFLTQMNPSRFCNTYYRIERNAWQFSTIKQLPITNLT